MITGSGSVQLAVEYINQALGNAASWRNRLEAHGPNVTRHVYDNCISGIRYWEHVAESWEREIRIYNASTNQEEIL